MYLQLRDAQVILDNCKAALNGHERELNIQRSKLKSLEQKQTLSLEMNQIRIRYESSCLNGKEERINQLIAELGKTDYCVKVINLHKVFVTSILQKVVPQL
jgi:hypothetical protein